MKPTGNGTPKRFADDAAADNQSCEAQRRKNTVKPNGNGLPMRLAHDNKLESADLRSSGEDDSSSREEGTEEE